MTEKAPSPNGPALTLFPIYETYLEMATTELEGLTDGQLDWESDRWGWSQWSIRRNISHVASHLFRHYLLSRNWGSVLFPTGKPYRHELYYLAALPTHRLDEERWWEIDAILEKLGQALEMVRSILQRETVASVRELTISQGARSYYDQIADQYPGTLLDDPRRPGQLRITLEGNFRLSEAEMVTHLYNVHRLKRAQGLQARVTLPRVGFWLLPTWDTSEP